MRAPRSALPVVVALVLGACASNDGGADGPATDDEAGSAAFVTTTTTDPDAATTTTADSATSATDTTPTDTTVAPIGTRPTSSSTSTSTSTTTVPTDDRTVGNPVVTSEIVGEFDQPIDLAVRPGDNALYVVNQTGTIVRHDETQTAVVAELGSLVSGGGEQGLLGLAFHPTQDLAYVNYTDRGGDTIIAEYGVDAVGRFAAESRLVLTVDQPYRNHNAGELMFGPDGMLYIPLGDGGSANDPERRAQDPRSLLGSMLRIDPTSTGDAAYTIPADNPFAGGEFEGIAGAPEVWAWGLRNPWKIAFDPVTDELWIADVGQNEFEEVNVVAPAGGNPAGRGLDFGWSALEGAERFNDDIAVSDRNTLPVLTYRHGNDGCSISGGVPYRGTAIPELAPAYVYSDFCSGILWALDLAGQRNLTLLTGFDSVSAVRAGPDGELYVLERSGTVHRLIAG
ncbi:MAG: PQQ-dependent sugar dehydrogenase [Ilumatobacter sp.]|uniref:PQQ-dependent sugar dehydrogenase n=1 Tax=Ilumatobacter sp. TaxID=1967498 RepID=UPI0026094F1C|nr:PQQ-dependent sugar dehydrogenase [Ilumatobacter sp.]MDJ0771336.1 PQQ-dependent sugar dehydrogenase [Ilumatobacter sp.]